MINNKWIIWKIDKKTKVPSKYKEGKGETLLIIELEELYGKEDIYAVRFNLEEYNE